MRERSSMVGYLRRAKRSRFRWSGRFDPQSQYRQSPLGRGGDRLTDAAAQNDLTCAALILRCEICICFLKRSLSLGASTARCWLPTSSQIAARPTLMRAPTNQPHRQKIAGLFLGTIHLSFFVRHSRRNYRNAPCINPLRRTSDLRYNSVAFGEGGSREAEQKKSSERNPCSRLLWHSLRPYSCSRQHHRARLLRRPDYWQQKARRT